MSRTIPARRGRPVAAPLPQRKNSLSLRLKRISRAWQLYVLLTPAIIYILVFKYWPMYGVQIAFKNYNPVDGFTDSPWVGLTHFIRFVNSYQFGQVVGNTLWIAVLGLLLAFPIPIILALLVNQLQSEKFKKFTQTVLYSPAFISTVVVVGIMFVVLSPRSGLVNNAIQLGGGEPIFFMGSAEWFRPIYVISDVWQNAGFSMIVYLAALAAIDPALHDAAKVDGASKLQRIRHIDLPGIMPVVTILFILAIGNLLNVGFEKALLMQTPLNISTSEVIQTYVYHAGLQQAQFSYSAAIGLFNSLLNLALLLVFNTIARRANQATLW
ncbi:ABC transporter permease subunit [Pseudarthrobacter sp. MDT3-26]|uniref:ABC transporter permease n=1 Tax=Pseudarthrobacter raffinosi TaxID=2953651 RepID=UPI00208F95AE|nr:MULTISPECIES: ABC transporter permease subunit [unclassified Pseudarthrobacter]MCO4237478.1 ABC transporter permease subunit [Pseudarthrobacter sp. MDT3-28]MCO4262789.1 ABC transporter permease subunit [Pseudarthrobacter sp. MDT3-26]